MSGRTDRRDGNSKPARRNNAPGSSATGSSSAQGQKIPSRLDELRSLRRPSTPSSSTSGQVTPSALDKQASAAKPKSTLEKQPGPSASAERESMHKTSFDKTMAARQTRITKLPAKEREIQEAWARKKIHSLPSKCGAGFDYERCDGLKGYRCTAGAHLITDELLAEGTEGYLELRNEKWTGPHYHSKG